MTRDWTGVSSMYTPVVDAPLFELIPRIAISVLPGVASVKGHAGRDQGDVIDLLDPLFVQRFLGVRTGADRHATEESGLPGRGDNDLIELRARTVART